MKKLAAFLLSLMLCMSALTAPPQALCFNKPEPVPVHNTAEVLENPEKPDDPKAPVEPGKPGKQGSATVLPNDGPGFDHESH